MKRRVDLRRASCYSYMNKQNNSKTREILFSAMWSINQKIIHFRCRTSIRDEPARTGPTRPGHDVFDALYLKIY